MNMLTRTPQAMNGAILFDEAQDMLLAMFGAPDHDWHVKRYRVWLKDQANRFDLAPWDTAKILSAIRASKQVAS